MCLNVCSKLLLELTFLQSCITCGGGRGNSIALVAVLTRKETGESRISTETVRFYLPWALIYNHKDTVQRKQRIKSHLRRVGKRTLHKQK